MSLGSSPPDHNRLWRTARSPERREPVAVAAASPCADFFYYYYIFTSRPPRVSRRRPLSQKRLINLTDACCGSCSRTYKSLFANARAGKSAAEVVVPRAVKVYYIQECLCVCKLYVENQYASNTTHQNWTNSLTPTSSHRSMQNRLRFGSKNIYHLCKGTYNVQFNCRRKGGVMCLNSKFSKDYRSDTKWTALYLIRSSVENLKKLKTCVNGRLIILMF